MYSYTVYNDVKAYGYMLRIYYLSKMYSSIFRCTLPLTPDPVVSVKTNRRTM